MTPEDFGTIAGFFFLSWAIGYCAGYLFKVVRRIFEVSGGGSA